MTAPSETPLTDAKHGCFFAGEKMVPADFARSLETAIAESRHWIGELLAVIHRDGGHYEAEHGTEKAVKDAMAKASESHAECERLRKSERDAFERAAKVCDELEDYLWNYGSPGARVSVQDVACRIRALAGERRNET